MNECVKGGHRPGKWEPINDTTQGRACTECGLITVTAYIPSPKIVNYTYKEHVITSALECNHANEVPNTCPCPVNCYCKSYTCLTNRYEA